MQSDLSPIIGLADAAPAVLFIVALAIVWREWRREARERMEDQKAHTEQLLALSREFSAAIQRATLTQRGAINALTKSSDC